MPIACNPRHRTRFHLDADKDEPEASRPSFECRFITADELCEIQRLYREAYDADDDKCKTLLNEALLVAVTGWRGMPHPKTGESVAFPGPPSIFLSATEMREAVNKLILATTLGEYDLKKSLSPSASPTESSAPSAPAASAIA